MLSNYIKKGMTLFLNWRTVKLEKVVCIFMGNFNDVFCFEKMKIKVLNYKIFFARFF